MHPTSVRRYADEVVRLQDAAATAPPFTSRDAAFGVAEAYAVSREVLRHREAMGWRRLGRKIGFTNRQIWDQYGVYEPIFGYMYDRTVAFAAGGDAAGGAVSRRDESRPDEMALAGLCQPLIEPEIVFHLRAPPPRTDDPAALLDCIDWVAHGFEVVQCHFPGWRFSIADTIADGGLHGSYVAGPRLELTDEDRKGLAERLATFRITLLREGEPVRQGGGDLVLGSPLNALAHLVAVLAALPDHPPLQAGELVTTGTLTDAMPVSAGETWSTRLDGLQLAGMSLRFV